MSTNAAADAEPTNAADQIADLPQESESEKNCELPGRIMAMEEIHDDSHTQNDDAATAAASEELKHTSISDKGATISANIEVKHFEREGGDKDMVETGKASTPELELSDAQDDEMRERLSSPKKKRGRDQDDDIKDLEEKFEEPGSSADGSIVNGGRSSRSGPEKKRPRDNSEDRTSANDEIVKAKDVANIAPSGATKTASGHLDSLNTESDSSKKTTFVTGLNDQPQISASTFANSGFASLAASSTSGFGTIGASKPSAFGGGTQSSTSGFGVLAGAKSPTSTSTVTTGGFGGFSGDKLSTGFGFGSGAASGFGGLGSSSVFGSTVGNGFGGGAGQKLSSFAAPGAQSTKQTRGGKPAKAFGAPESDEEEGSDGDDSDAAAASDDESKSVVPEDKKKGKLAKVHVEDGESGEATLLQIRAKLFALDSKETGWKERGVGTLKINVPQSCVTFDDNGHAIPGSFDSSGLEDEEEDSTAPRVARLIMRQENTHRVILNTIIVRAMEFQDKPSTTTAQILFTAFEGDKEPKPINMLLKMSEANARLFRSEIDSIQHEL